MSDSDAIRDLVEVWLRALSQAPTNQLIPAALRQPSTAIKAAGLHDLALLVTSPTPDADHALRTQLRSVPGLGPERADVVGVFGFHRPWPVTDEYLWRLLTRHDLLGPDEAHDLHEATASFSARLGVTPERRDRFPGRNGRHPLPLVL